TASHETQIAVKEAAHRQRGDEEQAEVCPRDAICADAAREDVDPEKERIAIDYHPCCERLPVLRDPPRNCDNDRKRRRGPTESRSPESQIQRGQTNRRDRKQKFDRQCEIAGGVALAPSDFVRQVPTLFKAEHDS